MTRYVPSFVANLLVLCALSACANAGATRNSASDWQLEFGVSGGIDGRMQSLTVRADGHLFAQDQRRARQRERQMDDATREQLTRLVAALTDPAAAGNAPAGPLANGRLARPCPDCVQYVLDIAADGRRQSVRLDSRTLPTSPYGELVRVLATLLQQSLNEAAGAAGDPTRPD